MLGYRAPVVGPNDETFAPFSLRTNLYRCGGGNGRVVSPGRSKYIATSAKLDHSTFFLFRFLYLRIRGHSDENVRDPRNK